MKKLKCFLCLILIFISVFQLCSCSKKNHDPQNQIINYNIDFEPVTLDPQIANDSGARLIIMNIFEGLVRLGENEEIQPGAAENWDISSDDMQYIFHIRKDAVWNDNTPLTAQDFVFGITRALKPETKSPTASTLYCIKNAEKFNLGIADKSELGIYAIDSNTLIINLDYQNPEFLKILASPPAMPCNQQFFTKTSGRYGCDDDMILSNGAFFVRKNGWEHNQYIYIRKNANYAGEDQPIPAGVNITIGNTPSDICSAIADGTIDFYPISANELKNAKELDFTLTSFEDTVWGIAFNTQNSSLSDINVRLALLSAANDNNLLDDLTEGFIPTTNIIPDNAEINNINYRETVGNCYRFKISENAKAQFQEGIIKSGSDLPPKLTILCTNNSSAQSMVNNIMEKWNNLTGGYVNKQVVTISEMKDKISEGDYTVAIVPITAQSQNPIDTIELFTSKSDYNIANLHSYDYDRLVENAKNQQSASKAQKIFEAEIYLVKNGIFYPLYVESRYYACSKNISGIIFHPYGSEADFFFAEKNSE